jgi:DUF1680 family protein
MKIAGFLAILLIASPAFAILSQNPPGDRLEILAPAAVHIDGWIGGRIDANIERRLLTIDNEPLLAGYRHRPGNHPWIGEHVGKWLHAATLAWAYTHDPRLREKIDRTAAELIRCQEADGYLGTYSSDKRFGLYPGNDWDVWSHKYNLIGLLTYYQYTGDRAALDACRKMGDLLISTFPDKKSILAAGTHQGMAATSVLEPVMLLYKATGDKRYLDFARYIIGSWDEPGGPKLLASLLNEKQVNKTANGKAYEMLSNLVGLGEFYRATGDEKLLHAIRNAWQDIVDNRLYATGSASSFEHFQGDHVLPNGEKSNICETCVTVTWMQLNLQLLRLTGEAKYGDEFERSLYNHLAAAQHPRGDDWCYYTALEGRKHYDKQITCCHSSGPRGMAIAPQAAYFDNLDCDGHWLVVNTLESSCGTLQLGGQQVVIEQASEFPRRGHSRLTLQTNKRTSFGIRIRIPAWALPAEVVTDGRTIKVDAAGWTTLPARRWKNGDRVSIDFHLGAKLIVGDHGNAGRAAIAWGPFVLVCDQDHNGGIAADDALAFVDARPSLTPKPGRELAFEAKVAPSKDARPETRVFVPFADAGASGGQYCVWLRDATAKAGDDTSNGATKIDVQADRTLHPMSRLLTGACIEDVNHEIYGGIFSQLVFGESFQEDPPRGAAEASKVSRMWRPVKEGTAEGTYAIDTNRPFVGRQSQRMTFTKGEGRIGVENRGLNHWGMKFAADRSYEGVVWARAEKPAELFATLENNDGSQSLAESRLTVKAGDWQQLAFTLTPKRSEKSGRFVVSLKSPGSALLGYAFLQPGEWGRYKGLPVRRDVAEGLVSQGITVLRYGGSMVNNPEYRWKKMIGPREKRPPYRGHWYPHSSNGWGIVDFMDFCEAAGFEYVPAFDASETPADMADYIEYATGPKDSEWGRRRSADGHAALYRLKYIEIGNEEKIDDAYYQKFAALAPAIWAKDANVILVVGDFQYSRAISDPFHFSGAASGITSLAAHRKILQIVKQHNREVWFDVHVNTEGPTPDSTLAATRSYIDALDKIADGAQHRVVVFELNANNHSQRRALANAIAIHVLARDGRLPIVTSANCLQADGQNDNGWNQGLLFYNPSQVWLQPPGYVTQIYARNYLPLVVEAKVHGGRSKLDVIATRSDDGRRLVLRAVNPGDKAEIAQIHLTGFEPKQQEAHVAELAGPLNTVNTATQPEAIVPQLRAWRHAIKDGSVQYTFPPYSITVIRLE